MSSTTKSVLSVNGMTCQSCVKNIERNVGKIDGVTSVKVSLEDKQAEIEWESGKTTEQALVDKINSLGFQAQSK